MATRDTAGELADRIRALLPGPAPHDERRMFGGRAFMVEGRIAVAIVSGGDLIVRLDPGEAQAVIARGEATEMAMGERTMRGWVRITPGDDAALADWVQRGVARARALAHEDS